MTKQEAFEEAVKEFKITHKSFPKGIWVTFSKDGQLLTNSKITLNTDYDTNWQYLLSSEDRILNFLNLNPEGLTADVMVEYLNLSYDKVEKCIVELLVNNKIKVVKDYIYNEITYIIS